MTGKTDKDLVPQKQHILVYIAEIAGQLSDMAHRADCEILGEDLQRVVVRAKQLHEDHGQSLP